MAPPFKLFLKSFAIVALLSTAALFGCLKQDAGADKDIEPMRVATLYWPGMYWVDVARAKGWFEEEGLIVQFVDANPDYYAAVDALEAGNLDTITLWLFDLLKRSDASSQLTLVLATDESAGSEALIAAPHIQSVSALRGKRIAVPPNSALVYELDAILARFGMSLDDVTLVDTVAEQAVATLASAKVDAVMAWEPFASEAVAAGGKSLYDSSKLPGLVVAGMAFRKDFITERPLDVQRFANVWQRAVHYIEANPDQAFAIVADVNKVTPKEVRDFAQRNRILNLRDNIVAFTYASGVESLFGSARKINRFLMSQEGATQEPIEGVDVLDGRFVHELAKARGEL